MTRLAGKTAVLDKDHRRSRAPRARKPPDRSRSRRGRITCGLGTREKPRRSGLDPSTCSSRSPSTCSERRSSTSTLPRSRQGRLLRIRPPARRSIVDDLARHGRSTHQSLHHRALGLADALQVEPAFAVSGAIRAEVVRGHVLALDEVLGDVWLRSISTRSSSLRGGRIDFSISTCTPLQLPRAGARLVEAALLNAPRRLDRVHTEISPSTSNDVGIPVRAGIFLLTAGTRPRARGARCLASMPFVALDPRRTASMRASTHASSSRRSGFFLPRTMASYESRRSHRVPGLEGNSGAHRPRRAEPRTLRAAISAQIQEHHPFLADSRYRSSAACAATTRSRATSTRQHRVTGSRSSRRISFTAAEHVVDALRMVNVRGEPLRPRRARPPSASIPGRLRSTREETSR